MHKPEHAGGQVSSLSLMRPPHSKRKCNSTQHTAPTQPLDPFFVHPAARTSRREVARETRAFHAPVRRPGLPRRAPAR